MDQRLQRLKIIGCRNDRTPWQLFLTSGLKNINIRPSPNNALINIGENVGETRQSANN